MQPEMLKFKVDENLPEIAAKLLREAGFDAETVLSEELGGSPDSVLAAVCLAEGRALVTLDLDFSDIRTYPPGDYPGFRGQYIQLLPPPALTQSHVSSRQIQSTLSAWRCRRSQKLVTVIMDEMIRRFGYPDLGFPGNLGGVFPVVCEREKCRHIDS